MTTFQIKTMTSQMRPLDGLRAVARLIGKALCALDMRVQTRSALTRLSARQLRDIGLTPHDVELLGDIGPTVRTRT